MGELDNSSSPLLTVSTATGGEASLTSSAHEAMTHPEPPQKKKRNLPGMPDPEAEVIALSPTTLLATNRFVCEICNKGFQRDQNLQLHRRGHNLPWKLKQRTSKEVRKRVYVCPETSCVHHHPTRALGDLTGIKKHFCRKHGEKKWKCERCSKKYAVQSDWKAHMKTCGTREYKCDCGTLFSRRDSFITHRAFCDALAEESAKTQTLVIGPDGSMNPNSNPTPSAKSGVVGSPPPPPHTPSNTVVSPALSIQSSDLPENPIGLSPPAQATSCLATTAISTTATATTSTGNCNNGNSVFASIFAPSSASALITQPPGPPQTSPPSSFSNQVSALGRPDGSTTMSSINEPTSLSLTTSLYLSSNGSSLFPTPDQDHRNYAQPAAMSATALLQKAAQMGQMGAAASNASLLRGLGLSTTSSPSQESSTTLQWNKEPESGGAAHVGAELGLELLSTANAAQLTDLMMGPPSSFGGQPMTRDLLGLSIGSGGGGGASAAGFSAFLNSFGGSGGAFNVATAYGSGGGGGGSSQRETWEGAQDRKPDRSSLL
ncbi:zinc finger protein NUTCRACKER-like [Pyrus ussuriensis x Pyrus communis]|uniref:Zinc finger protein NUTCRACKER-like n=1 Tax=Pyrus ussuriensis x Pyrus communis TaxID=2448454 RepID=A0A5N5GWW4_9ROSA|nr:zinc finger protein NUTCRACKER-like [Pyrus ussuriensis x Pyrus communis]